MAKPTQAHLSRTIEKNQPQFLRDRTIQQMEYYMGAKLIEVGVDPKSTIYRWTTEIKGNQEVITCSAYWKDSKDRILQEEAAQSGN
ncbi:MAG TPA: hypothetical protein IGS53_20575 [Leptolyngbyaceae cyanobacterium M33_DOE_097]|uniref:Uncharacterized protein n=1 Tax=Oscillatoriales cyanobacterium SpSt-418 TaxID=2282169 RepID=A0A7C3PFP3_9CYAN|nr:hypothetical protein [Leptolyngbyaceae cyanobacterium M33_DOE_097]